MPIVNVVALFQATYDPFCGGDGIDAMQDSADEGGWNYPDAIYIITRGCVYNL